MPITITPGPPGNLIGPGITIGTLSDFIGPLPSNTFLETSISIDPEGLQLVERTEFATQSVSNSWQWSTPSHPVNTIGQYASNTPFTVHITARLHASGVTTDTGTTTATWSPDTKLGLQNQLWAQQTTGTGGFTEADRATMGQIEGFVQIPLPSSNQVHIATSAADFITHPPIWFLDVNFSPTLLTGRGTLPIPADPLLFNTYGLIPHFVDIPPGAGRRDGQLVEYSGRVVQFVAMNTTVNTPGIEYVGDFVNFAWENQPWLWAQYRPTRLLFDVTPGFSVQVSWLSANGTSWPVWPP